MKAMNRAVAAAVLLCTAQRIDAANLIQNPDFDNGVAGWSVFLYGTMQTVGDGSPAAPSLQSTTTFGGAFIQQCVSLAGTPPPWVFGARTRVVSSGAGCYVSVVAKFANTECPAGSYISAYAATTGTVAGAQGAFTQWAGTVNADPMPSGSASKSATFSVEQVCPSGSSTINIDNAYVGPSGDTPVSLQSFEVK